MRGPIKAAGSLAVQDHSKGRVEGEKKRDSAGDGTVKGRRDRLRAFFFRSRRGGSRADRIVSIPIVSACRGTGGSGPPRGPGSSRAARARCAARASQPRYATWPLTPMPASAKSERRPAIPARSAGTFAASAASPRRKWTSQPFHLREEMPPMNARKLRGSSGEELVQVERLGAGRRGPGGGAARAPRRRHHRLAGCQDEPAPPLSPQDAGDFLRRTPRRGARVAKDLEPQAASSRKVMSSISSATSRSRSVGSQSAASSRSRSCA